MLGLLPGETEPFPLLPGWCRLVVVKRRTHADFVEGMLHVPGHPLFLFFLRARHM